MVSAGAVILQLVQACVFLMTGIRTQMSLMAFFTFAIERSTRALDFAWLAGINGHARSHVQLAIRNCDGAGTSHAILACRSLFDLPRAWRHDRVDTLVTLDPRQIGWFSFLALVG